MSAVISGPPMYEIIKLKSIDELRQIFPDAKANDMNFCLFSTSGVHGFNTTIEDAVREKDYRITVLVVHPRIVVLRYGTIAFEKEDVPYLKQLRRSSQRVASKIGGPYL